MRRTGASQSLAPPPPDDPLEPANVIAIGWRPLRAASARRGGGGRHSTVVLQLDTSVRAVRSATWERVGHAADSTRVIAECAELMSVGGDGGDEGRRNVASPRESVEASDVGSLRRCKRSTRIAPLLHEGPTLRIPALLPE